MKRTPLRRKTPLKADPAKGLARTPLSRGQDGALRRKKPSPRAKPREPQTAAQGPTAAEFRAAVWMADGGRCVMCGDELPREAGPWVWHCHHVLLKQHFPAHLRRDPDGAILLDRRCHERHTSRTATVPLERLPWRVLSFAARLGPAAEDRLLREHPPQPEGGPTWPT